jgi:hypothetical protein
MRIDTRRGFLDRCDLVDHPSAPADVRGISTPWSRRVTANELRGPAVRHLPQDFAPVQIDGADLRAGGWINGRPRTSRRTIRLLLGSSEPEPEPEPAHEPPERRTPASTLPW